MELIEKLIEEYNHKINKHQNDLIDYPDHGEFIGFKIVIKSELERESLILKALENYVTLDDLRFKDYQIFQIAENKDE